MKLPTASTPLLGAMFAFIATLAMGVLLGTYPAQSLQIGQWDIARESASGTLTTSEGQSASVDRRVVESGETVRPAQSWLRPSLLALAAALMAVIAYSILRQPLLLRREVEARTAELRRANAALARSSTLLRSASINGRVFPWEWDVVNDKLHWGVPPEEMLGSHTTSRPQQRDFRDMVHPDDREGYLETGRRTVRDGSPYYCEFRLVGADNLVRWIAARGEALRDASGRVVSMVGASIDITERKQAEESLRQFSRAAEQINQGVMITDACGHIEYVNPHFCHSTGYRSKEVIGRNPRFLASGETAPEVYRHLWDTLRRGETWRGELKNRRRDGSLYWESEVISPVRNDAGEISHFVAVKEDVSARKEAEEEAQQLTEELAEKNRELESFSHTVSHDLRAPLRAVDGFVSLALENAGSGLGQEARGYLERAKANAARMGRLIEDLLELSRLSRREIRRQEVDLSRLAGEIVADLRQLEPQRRVEVVIADGLADTADPVLLRNVMQNLLGNAWKFTRKVPVARIEFGVRTLDGARRYHVKDNGAGFDMKFADRLFGAFQRLHNQSEFEGTGIGLASVARILKRHGGSISAQATPGQGATFEFTLE
jgi:PAS domain S-box-containing protein